MTDLQLNFIFFSVMIVGSFLLVIALRLLNPIWVRD